VLTEVFQRAGTTSRESRWWDDAELYDYKRFEASELKPLYTGVVKADLRVKNGAGVVIDFESREGLARFRKAAKAFTKRATQSRETAMQVLVSEGIYTKSGKLAKNYR